MEIGQITMASRIKRCWNTQNPLYLKYHDEEWGVPVHEDSKLFEFLTLEGFQAGLSWELILNKREAFKKAFDNFQPQKIATYDEAKVRELLNNSNIIRNKSKVQACIQNASLVIEIQKEYGSFNNFIWSFRNKKLKKQNYHDLSEMPTETEESIVMSKELKKRGFKYVGPKICYSFMQAVGIVNDHLVQCFRYKQIN